MKFARRERSTELAVEITPLIDVVFLLLIFFMVSTTFIRETQLRVELPEADGALQETENRDVVVTISDAGSFVVEGAIVDGSSTASLQAALRASVSGDTDRRVVITADAGARHEWVVRIMDAAGQLGLSKISITTRPTESGVDPVEAADE